MQHRTVEKERAGFFSGPVRALNIVCNFFFSTQSLRNKRVGMCCSEQSHEKRSSGTSFLWPDDPGMTYSCVLRACIAIVDHPLAERFHCSGGGGIEFLFPAAPQFHSRLVILELCCEAERPHVHWPLRKGTKWQHR